MRTLCTILLLTTIGAFAQGTSYSEEVKTTYREALSAIEQNNQEQATLQFEKCIRIDSTCFEAHIGLGKLAYAAGELEKTLLHCENAKTIRPFSPSLSGLMGRTYYLKSDYEKATSLLKRAISTGENTVENRLFLAQSLQYKGHLEEALIYLDELVQQDGKNANFYFSRGSLYMEMEALDKAIADFNAGIRFAPEEASAYINLGKLYLTKGQDHLIPELIEKGLQYATANQQVDLFILQGVYLQRQGNLNEAKVSYEKAYALAPKNAIVLTHQGGVLVELENYELAIEKCNQALAENRELTEAYFNRGIAKEMIRDIKGACTDWEQAFLLGSQRAVEYLNGPICNE